MRQAFLISSVLCSLTFALAKSFDYVIIGAGTSGLVVANRLSEDPMVTVVVIEAGTDQRNNPNVTDPSNFTKAFGTSIDWQYKTKKQASAGNRELTVPQGKAWGGTSAINGGIPSCI
jgi:choline dehydrogenase-like flavoprotein